MTSDEIKKMIFFDEGVRLDVYLCPAKKLTVGAGHNIEADPARHILHSLKLGDKITPEQAQALYEYDINRVINNLVTKIPGYSTFQEKYKIVLINMAFNLGINGLLQFKNMLQAMRTDNDIQVIQEIKNSKYYKDVTNRANRMISIINNIIPDVYK